jgi:HSP20 family protein
MKHDLTRLMHALFLPAAEAVREALWHPAVDVYRTRDGFLVKFDLAGVRPEDMQITLSKSSLTVHGSRRDCCLEEGCSHYLMEIAYSRFERTVTLPTDLARARVTLEHSHGMLLVRIRTEASDS